MPLSDVEFKVLSLCEQFFLQNQRLPDLTEVKHYTALPEVIIEKAFKKKDFKEALKRRGIEEDPNPEILTPKQLAVANVLLDFTDRRSVDKKLRECGVNRSQYHAWIRSKPFQNYMRQRSESMIGDNSYLAHTAFVQALDRGDMNAVRVYFEMTGKVKGNQNERDYKIILMHVMESIKRHVRDPEILEAIGKDIISITGAELVSEVEREPVPALPPPAPEPKVFSFE